MQTKKTITRYFKESFSSDLKAGFITAIIALPLASAFVMASGVEPVLGLYTAVIAGILGFFSGRFKHAVHPDRGRGGVLLIDVPVLIAAGNMFFSELKRV
jgi:SulP family sulfate permease